MSNGKQSMSVEELKEWQQAIIRSHKSTWEEQRAYHLRALSHWRERTKKRIQATQDKFDRLIAEADNE